MEKKQVVCSSRQGYSTLARFGKEQCGNTSIIHPLLTWLQTIFTCFLEWNQHWRNGCIVKLLTSLRMWRKSWKGFHNMASRNVSNNFTDAGRCVSLQNGKFWRKNNLNDCFFLYFTDIKYFQESCKATVWANYNATFFQVCNYFHFHMLG